MFLLYFKLMINSKFIPVKAPYSEKTFSYNKQ